MMTFNFIASDEFHTDNFNSIEKFVDLYSDFQTVILEDEKELELLLRLIGIKNINSEHINKSEFSKYWNISNFKLPDFDEAQFNQFYDNWLKKSSRDNNMDEYGSLIFLQGLSTKWNKLKFRLIYL